MYQNNTKEQIKTLIPQDKFLKCNNWEQRFIAQVMHYDKLTMKQMNLVKEISKKYRVKDVKMNAKELADNIYS